jgi:hypothetical protein
MISAVQIHHPQVQGMICLAHSVRLDLALRLPPAEAMSDVIEHRLDDWTRLTNNVPNCLGSLVQGHCPLGHKWKVRKGRIATNLANWGFVRFVAFFLATRYRPACS